ncbi:MAG: hypothetical protein ACYT04_79950, partial [Nostoc sp.]
QPGPSAKIDDSPDTPEAVSPLGSSNLDQQLDSLIQMFFTSQTASASPPPAAKTDVDSNPAIWETLATILEDDEELENPDEEQLEAEINRLATTSTSGRIDSGLSPANNLPVSSSSPHTETPVEDT